MAQERGRRAGALAGEREGAAAEDQQVSDDGPAEGCLARGRLGGEGEERVEQHPRSSSERHPSILRDRLARPVHVASKRRLG